MPKITESEIEEFAIELLEKQAYTYVYGYSIAPDSDSPERSSFEEVILADRLKKAIVEISPHISSNALEDAFKQIMGFSSPDLIANNESFHRALIISNGLEARAGTLSSDFSRFMMAWKTADGKIIASACVGWSPLKLVKPAKGLSLSTRK